MALRIGFDVDGVLADFRTAFREAAVRCLRREVDDSESADTPNVLTLKDVRRVWEYIGKTPNWWMEVPAFEPEQIARLYAITRAAGWEVFFLTKRPPSAGDSVQFQTQWWIERFGFYLPAVLMLRSAESGARDHAINRGIGVVSTLAEAVTVLERLNDVLPQKRGRILRLADWFSPPPGTQTLPENPRAVRPIPAFQPRRGATNQS